MKYETQDLKYSSNIINIVIGLFVICTDVPIEYRHYAVMTVFSSILVYYYISVIYRYYKQRQAEYKAKYPYGEFKQFERFDMSNTKNVHEYDDYINKYRFYALEIDPDNPRPKVDKCE